MSLLRATRRLLPYVSFRSYGMIAPKITPVGDDLIYKQRDITINTKDGPYTEAMWTPMTETMPHWVKQEEIYAVLGYGPQGRAQSLNLRDNGYNVVIGVREGGDSWTKAHLDGWDPHTNLLDIAEATFVGTTVLNLLSDSGQKKQWPLVKSHLHDGDALCFSHGFGVVYKDQTHIVPPENVDVFLVAPKGPGNKVRESFLDKKGVNASIAVHNDYTGRALTRCMDTATAIGCTNFFETTFEKEVFSDLTGERCALMGAMKGLIDAQYTVLRNNGHSPLEAYNETVEEAFEWLYKMIGERGIDWMFANCSTTAQRGAIDWAPVFKDALVPVIEDCYESVRNGTETANAIYAGESDDYRAGLERELEEIHNEEPWQIKRELDRINNDDPGEEHINIPSQGADDLNTVAIKITSTHPIMDIDVDYDYKAPDTSKN